jgi:hypothetical protein
MWVLMVGRVEVDWLAADCGVSIVVFILAV